jgi:hypothetical protein
MMGYSGLVKGGVQVRFLFFAINAVFVENLVRLEF